MKLYGSLNNRFDENHYFNGTLGNIQVGTLCTVYLWSDRHAYEVVEVIDQSNISIRRLKAIRTDSNGMSDAQNWRYESNEKAATERIQLTKSGWKKVSVYNLARFQASVANLRKDCKTEQAAIDLAKFYFRHGLTEKQLEKVLAGKEVTKVQGEVNISFGIADEYYDYSF